MWVPHGDVEWAIGYVIWVLGKIWTDIKMFIIYHSTVLLIIFLTSDHTWHSANVCSCWSCVCLFVYVQLILKLHQFELCWFTYMWSFFNMYVLQYYSLRLVESVDAEPWIWRASGSYTWIFPAQSVDAPGTLSSSSVNCNIIHIYIYIIS